MKRRIIHFVMTTFMMFSLLIFAFLIADFSQHLTNSCEKNAAYALGRKHRRPGHRPHQNPGPHHSVPEPSTLALLGTGLVVGGGIYTFIRYRKRNKK